MLPWQIAEIIFYVLFYFDYIFQLYFIQSKLNNSKLNHILFQASFYVLVNYNNA